MDSCAAPDAGRPAPSFWKDPSAWIREKNLSRSFWIFFTAAFFYDTGFCVYFFLFNLYLLDFHFNERAIGLINGALTLGLLAGTLPVGTLSRRIGLRPLLLLCFVAAPLLGVLRACWMWEPAQIGLAFVAGLAMCSWIVCFLPTVSSLTHEENRASAISLIFSVGVGASALGGAICGYLPQWLARAGLSMQTWEVKRLILIASSAVAAAGFFAVRRLRLPAHQDRQPRRPYTEWPQSFRLSPFLRRFLPCMALWSAMLASFTPFANVYLSRRLHMPLARIGLIFSVAQVIQLFSGLLVPVLVRRLGIMNAIVTTQAAAAIALALMAGAERMSLAIALYLAFSAAQWMSSPALCTLLMNETPEEERSSASAMTMFCNNLVSAGATAGAGILLARLGYAPVLLVVASGALGLAVLCRMLLLPSRVRPPAERPMSVDAVMD